MEDPDLICRVPSPVGGKITESPETTNDIHLKDIHISKLCSGGNERDNNGDKMPTCRDTIKNYSEADWDRAKYAVRGKFKQYNAPRFSIGDKCLIHEIDYNQKSGERTQIKHYGIVCSEVYVGNHELCYDVLWKGTCESISDSRIKKR